MSWLWPFAPAWKMGMNQLTSDEMISMKIERQYLLILDDFGLQPMDNHSRSVLMEIIEDRHGSHSTIITSQ